MTGAFHDNAGFAIQIFRTLCQGLKLHRLMENIKRFHKDFPTRTENCYCAFSLGNVDTHCVYIHKKVTPCNELQLVHNSFTHCRFNLLWCDTNALGRWLNLHKTNVANEELVSRLFGGCEAKEGGCYTDCT